MYRYIKNVPILGQATNRSKALSMLDSNSKELAVHVAKCIAYGDSLHCLKHWLCEEIADWIKLAGTVKLKKNAKIKASVYKDTLFGFLGDEKSDALGNLMDLQIKVKRHKYDYPYFDITQEMVDHMYAFSQKLQNDISTMLENNKGNQLNDKKLQTALMNIYNSTAK